MKVRLICRNDQLSWIFGKIARRLLKELEATVDISLGPKPDSSADINHYIWYDDYKCGNESATIGITHIDSLIKFQLLETQLKTASAGICLSSEHMRDLAHAGLPAEKLCYVIPSHDQVISPKKLHIGITTRLYTPDPCKREWLLLDLAKRIDSADFTFSIMGSGWDQIVAELRQRGFEITYYREFELERYRSIVPTFDYYLYLGWDEGSMGFLDALHAGVKTIVTAQGFHLDVPGGISFPIQDIDSLITAFHRIAKNKHERTQSVSKLTWASYATKHLEIWQYLLNGRPEGITGSFHDGLNSLIAPKLPSNPARGKQFRNELIQIDNLREKLRQEYQADSAVRRRPQMKDDNQNEGLKASIIVPTRNRGALLNVCLESLASQSVSADHFEILVIDNGSTDSSEQTAKEFIQRHPQHNIRYFLEPIPGLLSGRHRGVAEANAEILCFVDDDIIADTGWLNSVLEAFVEPDVHLVGGPSIPKYETPPPYWLEQFYVDIPEGRFLDYLSLTDLGPVRKEIPPYLVWGLNYNIRKKTVYKLGGFHPDGVPSQHLQYRGDGEGGLSHKMLKNKMKCIYHPGAKVEHIIGNDRLQLGYFQERRFRQGISDSYSAIRSSGNTKEVLEKRIPQAVHPNPNEQATEFYLRLLRNETARAYANGFNFHLKAVQSDKELLAWVLRPEYLSNYRYDP